MMTAVAQKLLYAAASFDGPSIPMVLVELLPEGSQCDNHVETLGRPRH